MLTSVWKLLQNAFIDDHKAMTRGYCDLLAAIEARDFAAATSLASKLDEVAGSHIEFEEEYLYPQVKSVRGEAYASKLYDEHDEVLSVLVDVQALPADHVPTDEVAAKWTEGLRHGLDHAATCGSLLSHLQTQSSEKQTELLKALQQLRKQGHRWSELKQAAKRKLA